VGGFATGRIEGPNDDGSIAGGAGGGGGGCDDDFTAERNDGGGGGGGGGGALVLEVGGSLRVRGAIVSDGGGGGESRGQGGGGGGGAGGLVLARASELIVEDSALFSVRGGRGGASVSDGAGGVGGHGRIRLEDVDGVVAVPDEAVLPQGPFVVTTGTAAIPGPGVTLGVSSFVDTGVDSPRYAFDGSDPTTGTVAAATADLGLSGPIPRGASIRIEFEGASGEPFDGGVPDPRTRTGFVNDVRALDGRRFVRFRVSFTSPLGTDPADRPPSIDRLSIRYVYY
jgi:hypothetical protein